MHTSQGGGGRSLQRMCAASLAKAEAKTGDSVAGGAKMTAAAREQTVGYCASLAQRLHELRGLLSTQRADLRRAQHTVDTARR
jgi:hypothetical protein